MSEVKVKLPRTGPDGKALRLHPLVALVRARGGSLREVGNNIKHGMNRSTVSTYFVRAQSDRDVLVPADWVNDLVKMSGLPHYYWRPDVFSKEGVPPA